MLHPARTDRPAAASNSRRPSSHDLIALIEAEAHAVALSFGAAAPGAVAAALVDRLLLRIGGQPLYLPKRDPRKRELLHAKIRAAYTGNNVADLAQRHQLTARRVRQIVGGEGA